MKFIVLLSIIKENPYSISFCGNYQSTELLMTAQSKLYKLNFKTSYLRSRTFFSFFKAGPRIKIQSSPSFNRFSFGIPLNLTCIASENDELQTKQLVASSRPILIRWFDPQNHLAKDCTSKASLSEAAAMTCTLMVGPLTLNKSGNYTCQAKAESPCSLKSIPIRIHGKKLCTC